MTYKEEISKEELFELPLKQFDGEVLVFNQKRGVDKAVKYLSKFPFIGFDTETRPSFKNQFELPKSLLNLLSNPKIIKAGAAIRDDVRTLQINSFFEPGGFFELQDEAKRLRINNFSLKKLSGIVLGHKISKAQQLSNWEAPELSEAQLRYAATDAWVSYKIYEDFNKNSNE
jgi:hypothetical protein